jgi:adenylylsulfate kinase
LNDSGLWEAPATAHGPVIWVTGLSGAGKSSVAGELARLLLARGLRPVVLDGDELRVVLGATDAYGQESRRSLGFVYGRLCRLLSRQGHPVICATISLYHELHAWNRANLMNYVEVLLEVPREELERRDPKGIYAAADVRNVVGVGFDAEFPADPDLVIPNFGATSVSSAASRILRLCEEKGAWLL